MALYHAGEETTRVVPRTEALAEVAWDVVGTHISVSDLPPRLRPWMPTVPLGPAGDVATENEPAGPLWSTLPQAARMVRIATEVAESTPWEIADDRFAEIATIERKAAKKFGRLDVIPTGTQCIPKGLLTSRYTRTNDASDAEWLSAARVAVRLYKNWVGRALPSGSVAPHPVQRSNAMDSFIAVAQRGLPSYLGGWNPADTADHAAISWVLMTSGNEECRTVFRALEDLIGLPLHAVMYHRLQSAAREVIAYAYDAQADGPIAKVGITNRWPKVRDIWAVAMSMNLASRYATGYLLGLMRCTPYHQVLPREVIAYLRAVLRARGVDNPKAWRELVLAEDTSMFDQNIPPGANRAATVVLREMGVPVPPEEYWERTLTLGVLAARHKPGFGGYLYSRPEGQAMLSGSTHTAVGDTIINMSRAIIIISRRMGWTHAVTAERLFRYEWGFVASGDDTLLVLPRNMKLEEWSAEALALGFTTSVDPGQVYLAKMHSWDGSYTNVMCRVMQNMMFREQRFVPETPSSQMLSIAATRVLLERHPLRGAYDRWLRAVAPPHLQSFANYTAADLPALARAAMEEKRGDNRAVTNAVEDLAYRLGVDTAHAGATYYQTAESGDSRLVREAGLLYDEVTRKQRDSFRAAAARGLNRGGWRGALRRAAQRGGFIKPVSRVGRVIESSQEVR